LSWNNKLQDNYYYQEFSYVVRVSELLDRYREVVKKLAHPSGTKLFGDYQIIVSANTVSQVVFAQSSFVTLAVSESLSLAETLTSALSSSAAITELSGSDVIEPYASTLISVYASTLISDISGVGTLKLEDSVDATIT
jgi:hypothetical protein